jgi:hypothetical protein
MIAEQCTTTETRKSGCRDLAVLTERVGTLARQAGDDRSDLARTLDGIAQEMSRLRELISTRYGEELNLRIDERVQLDKAKHPPALPGWASLMLAALLSVCTGLIVFLATRLPAKAAAAGTIVDLWRRAIGH